MPKKYGKDHSSIVRKPYSEAPSRCESKRPTAQRSTFVCVEIVQKRKVREKWRRGEASTQLPTPPSTPLKTRLHGAGTPVREKWRRSTSSPSQSSLQASTQSSLQSSTKPPTPTTDVKKRKLYKGKRLPIWEVESAVEWLADNLDGSVFIDRLVK